MNHFIGLELTGMKMNENVKLHALPPTKIASKVYLTVLNAPKTFEISQEFQNRIQNSFQNQIITNGNTLPLMFYGKILKLRVNSIDSNCESDILTTELNKLSIDDQFYSIASSTLWTLFKYKFSLPFYIYLSNFSTEMKQNARNL